MNPDQTEPLHEQVRRLEQWKADQQHRPSKLAIYISFGGSLRIKPPMLETDTTTGKAKVSSGHQESLSMVLSSPPYYWTYPAEWRLVYETNAYFVYEQIV